MKGAERLRTKVCEVSATIFPRTSVHAHLVVRSRVLGKGQDGRHRDRQVVATDVEELGALDVFPDLGLLQVVDVVQVRGGKVGAQRAVVARDDDTASAGGGLLVVAVDGLDTSLLVDVLERLAVLVLADAANVDGRLLGEDVLCTTGRVLGSSTGNEHGVVVLDQVFVEAGMLLLGEDGIVSLELVLREQLLVAAGTASVSHRSCQFASIAAEGTYPTPWMSRRGFSSASSSKFPLAIVNVNVNV
jgi:hypothetical protein